MANTNKNWIWVILLIIVIILFYNYSEEILPKSSISTFSITLGEFSVSGVPQIEKDCKDDYDVDCITTQIELNDGSMKINKECFCVKEESGVRVSGITDMSIYERDKEKDRLEEER